MAQITAGIHLWYAPETSAGKKPTEGFVRVPGITEIPEIGSAPDTYETTSLDNLEYKTYIDGLKDTGGALGFTANDTPEFRTAVEGLITTQEEKEKESLGIWYFIVVPAPIKKEMSFSGKATPLGFGGAGINSVLTTTFYITPTGEPTWSDITVTDEKGE